MAPSSGAAPVDQAISVRDAVTLAQLGVGCQTVGMLARDARKGPVFQAICKRPNCWRVKEKQLDAALALVVA
jgi:hypothetical protein